MRLSSLISIIALLNLILLSCSGGTGGTVPDLYPDQSPAAGLKDTTQSVRHCWGIWSVLINPETASVEIITDRRANFQSNVINFLQPPMAPIQLLTIQIDPFETDLSIGKVACDITIKHPFPGSQFCGFDIKGVVMGDWEPYAFADNPNISASLPPSNLLQNPDGWSRWWNECEFSTYGTLFGYIEGSKAVSGWTSTHTLNAYKYFCDELGPFDPLNLSVESRGFFSSVDPGFNKRRYNLQFPQVSGPVFRFKYAVGASWVAPYENADSPYMPNEFPLEANMPEAYKIGIFDNGTTAFFECESSYGGDLNLFVDVYDWQFDGTVGTIADEIQSVTIESPTLFPDPIMLDLSEASVNPENPTCIRVPFIIDYVSPDSLENQLLLITVESGNITTYEPQIPGISGFDYPDGALAAYNIIEIPIKSEPPPNISPWPTNHADNARTGRTDIIGPATNNLKFVYQIDGPFPPCFVGGIVVDSQQRVIINADFRWLYCIDPNGESVWSYYLYCAEGSSSCTPALGSDDSIYVGNGSNLWRISKEGLLIWEYSQDYDDYGLVSGAIAVMDDGCVIFSTLIISTEEPYPGYIIKLDPSGEFVWVYDTGEVFGGVSIGNDETIYCINRYGEAHAIDQDGNLVWKTQCGTYGTHYVSCTPALGPGGIYIGSNNGKFYCLDYDGNIEWTATPGKIIMCAAAIGNDGNLYIGSHNKNLYCLDQVTGEIMWAFETSSYITWLSPVLDGDGHVYIGNNQGDFYCLTTDGELVWEHPLGSLFRCFSPAISDDGTLYVGNKDSALFAFKDE